MTEATNIDQLPNSARRVALLLKERGHPHAVVMLPETGKTSAEAAAGLGCSIAQIVKSILFRRRDDDAPMLVIASGANRVDEAKVEARVVTIGETFEATLDLPPESIRDFATLVTIRTRCITTTPTRAPAASAR